MVYFQTKTIHRTKDLGYDNFNLSSANIQCTRTVKINTLRISQILTVEINLSVLKLMYLG